MMLRLTPPSPALLGCFGLLLAACTERPSSEPQAPSKSSSARPAETPQTALGREEAAAQVAPPPQPIAPPTLPSDLVLHEPRDLALPGDRDLRVSHADADNRHAVIYLHGMCGDSKGADPWADLATRRGTLITVRADVSCRPERAGYKWPSDPALIEERIDKALQFVKEQRNGLLDVEQVTLVGYSQGSHRAELLVAHNPERYRLVVLGGHPGLMHPPNLATATRAAVLGGELEDTSEMRRSHQLLEKAGISSRFFLLPRAPHGHYGPEGPRVMSEVFDWLYGASPP